MMQEKIELAVESYENSIKINAKRPECYYNLGNGYVMKKKFLDAL
jgi:hypothetical protein